MNSPAAEAICGRTAKRFLLCAFVFFAAGWGIFHEGRMAEYLYTFAGVAAGGFISAFMLAVKFRL